VMDDDAPSWCGHPVADRFRPYQRDIARLGGATEPIVRSPLRVTPTTRDASTVWVDVRPQALPSLAAADGRSISRAGVPFSCPLVAGCIVLTSAVLSEPGG
jgi:hypothetical protein